MSIEKIAQHLINQVETIVPGKVVFSADKNVKLTKNLAVCIYVGDDVINEALIKSIFIVKILIDDDINSLSLLAEIKKLIHNSEPIVGSKWKYQGQCIDQLVGEQRYTVDYVL